jgi:caa(3)-type oxidase subunit IV
MDAHHNKNEHKSHQHHYILPDRVALTVGATLLILTGITVALGHVDLGRISMLVAIAIASVKAALVCLFFMNLKYDKRENGVIFSTSFLFLAIFIVLTGTDLFFRGDVYVSGPLLAAPSGGQAKFKTPWVASPELVTHGKELFAAQCTSCHGVNGMGDGLAAAALNPKPRNFHATVGWKNGHKPSQIFKTLKEGIAGGAMASYASLPSEDRWALSHYVAGLNPEPLKDSEADLALAGIKGGKAEGGNEVAPSIPIETAIEILSKGSRKAGS